MIGIARALVLILSSLIVLIGCDPESQTPTEPQIPTAVPTPERIDTQTILSQIASYPRVRDAAIKQDGRQLSLVLIVDPATSEEYAKELGENFVRITKTLIGDGTVGQSIGKGEMDYIIGVYYPNESKVAIGAKAGNSDRIRW